jgi:arylsulfatase A-like enzyme
MASKDRVIILIIDGIRPDMVNDQDTPNLAAFGKAGVVFTDSHAVYPTVTMMNSQALATGHYPDRAGLYGNIPWVPGASGTDVKGRALDYRQPVDIDSWIEVSNLDKHYGGKLLLVKHLFAAAQEKGLVTYTSGKSDPAFLFDLKMRGLIVDENMISPLSFANELKEAGFSLPANIRTLWPDFQLSSTNGDPTKRGSVVEMADNPATDPVAGTSSPYNPVCDYLMDVYLKHVLPKKDPDLSLLWLRNPDTTMHKYGMGSPAAADAIRNMDRLFGLLIGSLKALGIDQSTNLMVLSDHGFSNVSGDQSVFPVRRIEKGLAGGVDAEKGYSVSGEVRLAELLVKNGVAPHVYDGQQEIFDPVLSGIKGDGSPLYPTLSVQKGGKTVKYNSGSYAVPAALPPDAVIVASNPSNEYIYIPSKSGEMVGRIVRFLQSREEFGVIIVDDTYRDVPGTLKMSQVRLKSSEGRNPDIIVSYNYDESASVGKYRGTTYTGMWLRRGDHGNFSRSDINNTFIAGGPAFKRGVVIRNPCGNIDVAPTAAHLLRLDLPNTDGRVLHEALKDSTTTVSVVKRTTTTEPTPAMSFYKPTDILNSSAQRVEGKSTYYLEFGVSVVIDGTGRTTTYYDFARAVRQ